MTDKRGLDGGFLKGRGPRTARSAMAPAPALFKTDHPRWIDRVIDYFGVTVADRLATPGLDLLEAREGGRSCVGWWRRWESNPRPETLSRRRLRRYPVDLTTLSPLASPAG